MQTLLARLCALVATAFGGKEVSPAAFAPWIDWTMPDPDVAQEKTERRFLAMLMNAQDDG